MPSNDRRSTPRQLACFPAYVELDEQSTHAALLHDISLTGALMLTRTGLEVGESLKLHLHISVDLSQSHLVSAHVVRVVSRSLDSSDVWTHEIGVQFAEPLDANIDVERVARRLAGK